MPGITFGGLVSGIDTDSIIKAIIDGRRYTMKAVQDKIDRVGLLKGTLRTANTQLLDLQQKSLQLRLEAAFLSKKVTVSNPAVASATATFDALPRKAVLTVSQLARGAQATSGLGDRALARAAALLVQGNTANINGVNVGSSQLGGTRARATDLLTETLQAGRGAARVTAGDTITITGTRKSGAAANATF
ncbi:MAG TPA: flagellar cap protein FliD N-terminal domain-containing protein, partial [bacterium]|nr:flagellar cap protein FliD N-terminal domain-containing protein [bacterium]